MEKDGIEQASWVCIGASRDRLTKQNQQVPITVVIALPCCKYESVVVC